LPRRLPKGVEPMENKFVDTNVFLRYLTKDDLSKYERCREMFKRALEGEIAISTSGLVIAELIWTLLSYYKVPKAEVIEKVSVILGTENLFVPDKNVLADALVLYARRNIDFIDAYNAVLMKYQGLREIYSYDEDYETIEDIERKKP
jgi:predicted nucleic acid-binding protein